MSRKIRKNKRPKDLTVRSRDFPLEKSHTRKLPLELPDPDDQN